MASSVIGALRVMLGMDTAEFEAGATRAERATNRLQRNLERTGQRMQAVGRNLTLAISAPLVAFGTLAFRAASDAAELQSAFDQTFGDMAGEMNAWAEETGDAMGRSTQSMQQLANTFGIFFNQAAPTRAEAAEMSRTFAVLAQDLASFYNVTEEDALAKLRSGLSGEAEPLRDFGVFLDAASVNAEALRMGLAATSAEITEQDKILARYNLILAGTTNAQGDVARTSAGTANQMRAASAAFEELQVAIGQVLLPVITPLIEKLGEFFNWLTELPAPARNAAVAIGAIAAAVGPVVWLAGSMVTSFAALAPVLAVAAPWLAGFAAVGLLIAANWDDIAPALEAVAIGMGLLTDESERANAAMEENAGWVSLGQQLRSTSDWLQQLVDDFDAYNEASARAARENGTTIQARFQALWDFLSGMSEGVCTVMMRMSLAVREWLVDRLDAVWDTVTDHVDRVRQAFFNMYDAVVGHSYVPDMVDGIAAQMARLDGVMVAPVTRATSAAQQAFRELAADVRSILDRLFPEAAALRGYRDDLSRLAASDLPADQADEARRRLLRELAGVSLDGSSDSRIDVGARDVTEATGRVSDRLRDMAREVDASTVRIAESFAQMADRALGSLDSLINGIKSGGVLDIARGLLGVIDGFGAMFTGGRGFQLFGATFGANGTGGLPGFASGGLGVLGGFPGVDRNVLSLNGTPIARVSRGEHLAVSPANDRGALGVTVTMDPSTGALGAFVTDAAGRVVAAAAPALMQGGAALAVDQIDSRAARNFG